MKKKIKSRRNSKLALIIDSFSNASTIDIYPHPDQLSYIHTHTYKSELYNSERSRGMMSSNVNT